MRPKAFAILLAGFILLTWGCNIERPVLLDPVVSVAPPRVYQPPPIGSFGASKVALFILEAPENLPEVGYPLTQILYQTFLEKNLFLFVDVIPQTFPAMADALLLAKKQGFDLIVQGQVPYFLDSGTAAKTGLQMDLKFFDVHTGQMVSYISDAIGAEPSPLLDLIFMEVRPKPSPSIYALAQVLANRFSLVLAGLPVNNDLPKNKKKQGAGFTKLIRPFCG